MLIGYILGIGINTNSEVGMVADIAVAQLFTAAEVSKLLNVSELTVKRWAKQGKIPSVRIGRWTRRFSPTDIQDWVRANSLNSPTATS
jgi:excisionase family DNA binding protein